MDALVVLIRIPFFIKTNLWQHKSIYVCSGKRLIVVQVVESLGFRWETDKEYPPFSGSPELVRYEVSSVQNDFE